MTAVHRYVDGLEPRVHVPVAGVRPFRGGLRGYPQGATFNTFQPSGGGRGGQAADG